MYLGKRKILNPERHEQLRKMAIEVKSGAASNAFAELEGLLSKTQVSKQYFDKSQGWFSQKLNGCTMFNKKQAFTEDEYHQLAEAFRHIAMRLNAHADEIDAATMDEPSED